MSFLGLGPTVALVDSDEELNTPLTRSRKKRKRKKRKLRRSGMAGTFVTPTVTPATAVKESDLVGPDSADDEGKVIIKPKPKGKSKHGM